MDEMLSWVLEQMGVVVLSCTACFALWKKLEQKEKSFEKERLDHRKEIRELNDSHKEEIKTMQEHRLSSELLNREALLGIEKLLDQLQITLNTNTSELDSINNSIKQLDNK